MPNRVVTVAVLGGLMLAVTGCEQPRRKVIRHPEGTLIVPYETASAPSSCLVASTTMVANYLLGERRFTEAGMRAALRQHRLDEAKVTDIKQFLSSQGLEMVVLAGQVDGKPPEGLRFWVLSKGYPVICVMNQHAGDPQFNHAVVVTGFSANTGEAKADIVHYLDPAAREPLQSVGLAEFDVGWGRCDRTMMIVVQPPAETRTTASRPG